VSAGTGSLATLETVDRRVLGAFVCVDAITGTQVRQSISVSAAPWKVKPNRNGIYVIFDGPGFESLTTQFVPGTPWPAAVGFDVTLRDGSRSYLPRRATLRAPMSVPTIGPSPGGAVPNPAVVAALADPNAVFNPQRVAVYPSPSAAVGPHWGAIHASVTQQGTVPPKGLPWAVLRVVRKSDGVVLAAGQADVNGEALLAVVGLRTQASTSPTGPVMVSTVAATVTAYVDPSGLSQPPGWISNPDDILSSVPNPALRSNSQPVQIGSGIEMSLSFAIQI
jgi:hypothetical protein